MSPCDQTLKNRFEILIIERCLRMFINCFDSYKPLGITMSFGTQIQKLYFNGEPLLKQIIVRRNISRLARGIPRTKEIISLSKNNKLYAWGWEEGEGESYSRIIYVKTRFLVASICGIIEFNEKINFYYRLQYFLENVNKYRITNIDCDVRETK